MRTLIPPCSRLQGTLFIESSNTYACAVFTRSLHLSYHSGALTYHSGAVTYHSGAVTYHSDVVTYHSGAVTYHSDAVTYHSVPFQEQRK